MLDECTYVKSVHYSPYLRGARGGKVGVSAFDGVKPVNSRVALFKSEPISKSKLNGEHIKKRNQQK